MEVDMFFLVGLGIVFFIMLILLYIKDFEMMKKIKNIESALESLMQKNYETRKLCDKLFMEQEQNNISLEPFIDKKIEEEVNKKTSQALGGLSGIEEIITNFQKGYDLKLESLEERTKTLNKIVSPTNGDTEEKKIIEYYKNGKSIENIAKDLRLGVGRVEFVLKIHNELQ